MYVCIQDQEGKVLLHRNLRTERNLFLRSIAPYREDYCRSASKSVGSWATSPFALRRVGLGVASFPDAQKSYRDAESRVPIEVIATGEYPGDGRPKPVVFPESAASSEEIEGLRVTKLEKPIELKLASGLTASHRLRDLADVQDLIVLLQLPRELPDSLDASVRAKYFELWDSAQEAFSDG
jgi:hypothetical protein